MKVKSQYEKLVDLLAKRNWYSLRALTYAYNQSFNPKLTKDQAVEKVLTLLSNPPTIRRAVDALPADARDALQTLLAAGGVMPAHRFLSAFGPLPPYRPWRDDSPPAPWRHPSSPAERLWFLGLIFRTTTPDGEMVVVPAEIRALLPASLLPDDPAPSLTYDDAPSPPDPILDIAHFLAFLQGTDVRPFAGRWLTPRPLRALNRSLAHPDPTVPEAGSELQTGRIRFLHYLAEAAGLVAPVGGLLKPTTAAWDWLDAPEADRCRILWDGWRADLRRPFRERALWEWYRLPGDRAFARTFLDALSDLPADPDQQVIYLRARAIAEGTLPPGGDVVTVFHALRDGPLATLPPCDSAPLPPRAPATLLPCETEDTIRITLPTPPDRPPLRPLVALGLPTGDRLTRLLTRQRFVDLLARGCSRTWVEQMLRDLTGAPLPPDVVACLAGWEAAAHGLTLRRLTVLSAADRSLLDDLAEERSVRAHFQETLSPHHVAVDPNETERLLRALRRRGHTPLVKPGVLPSDAGSPSLEDEVAAYLWLALRITFDLDDVISLPVVPPSDLLDRLAASLDADRLAALSAQADAVAQRLRDAIDGYTPFPAPLPEVDTGAIAAAVERALEIDAPVEIVYHTAGRGERTTRVVEPLRLEERGGARYLVAFCRLRGEERVFRLDRIAAITS